MKRLVQISSLLVVCTLAASSLISCRGKAASKTVEVIEKAASKGGKAAKNVGRYGDDVYRAVDKYNSENATTTSSLKAVTYQCSTCAGYGQVNFFDDYGNYSHTGTCPDCDGTGEVTKYEFK